MNVGLGKLGKCPKCMRWSTAGSLLSWLVVTHLYLLKPHVILFDLTLILAMGFTSLLVAHIVAFTLRGVTGREEIKV